MDYNRKLEGDLAVQRFKNALKGLDQEERMKPKWKAMAAQSTQKNRISKSHYALQGEI